MTSQSIRTITGLISLIIFTSCQKPTPKRVSIEEQTPWGVEVFTIPSFPDARFNIIDFGAKPNPSINNQLAIQAAINQCAEKGGGIVEIPDGKWETSYLDLKSNVNLYLAKGAVLFFSDSIELYNTPTFTRWEGIECMNYHPLIYAKDGENIAISGEGKIDGNGKKWWGFGKGTQIQTLSKLYDQVQANIPPQERNCLAYEPTSYLRPSLIQFVNCKNILVEGIEVGSGPMWTTHFIYCENVIARNLRVITDGVNNDGITPDACHKVLIDNCYFSTGDDCIVIKSGLNEDGWRVGKPSQNIIIKNCKTNQGHGGIVIGSEMSGGVKNVYAYDCDFSHTERGLRFKSMKGRGGVIEDLWFDNIRMDSIMREAIQINTHYGSSSIQPRSDSVPTFKNWNFKNIESSYAEYAIRMNGLDEQFIDNMTFSNLTMNSKYGVVLENVSNCTFDSVQIQSIQLPVSITNGNNLAFTRSKFDSKVDTLITLRGTNQNIQFDKTNANSYKVPYRESAGKGVIEIKD
jgi:polygalacturonase